MTSQQAHVLIPDRPVRSLEEYRGLGGTEALRLARERGPEWVIDELKRSGLRGRGGAGFPTGVKWQSVRDDSHDTKYSVCNAAEGEPGTFKDRWLMRHNPFRVLEGLAIQALTVGARHAYLALKRHFHAELDAVALAADDMTREGVLGDIAIEIVPGPDEYLFGEEKAMLEVIQGNDPLPRILPPFQQGLFFTTTRPNPTAVNNVETLANVPYILLHGAEAFRSVGTEKSPGTMVFTVTGDVQAPGIYELPLGTPLRTLVEEIAGGPAEGRRVKAVFPGASAGVIPADRLDTPMDFDSMRAIGSGLGSAGFIVYDDSACIVRATLQFSRFLYIESCGQCPPCKTGSGTITHALERIEDGAGTDLDLEIALTRTSKVTDGQRCALPTGEQYVVGSSIQTFFDEFKEHLGRSCPRTRPLPFPKLVDYDPQEGRFTYDERYSLKRPDWTYADVP